MAATCRFHAHEKRVSQAKGTRIGPSMGKQGVDGDRNISKRLVSRALDTRSGFSRVRVTPLVAQHGYQVCLSIFLFSLEKCRSEFSSRIELCVLEITRRSGSSFYFVLLADRGRFLFQFLLLCLLILVT